MAHYVIHGGKVAVRNSSAKVQQGALIVGSAGDITRSDLPAAGLVALWNGLPGVRPITKFKDRRTATRRLWEAFKKLPAASELNGTGPGAARADTKQARVIVMLRRGSGTTVDQIAAATGWQKHTVRGMISGALKKKLGLEIRSAKAPRGRLYRIVAGKRAA